MISLGTQLSLFLLGVPWTCFLAGHLHSSSFPQPWFVLSWEVPKHTAWGGGMSNMPKNIIMLSYAHAESESLTVIQQQQIVGSIATF